MFKLVKNLTAWWPVTVLTPDDENPGTLKEEAFEAQFLILGREERKTLQDERDALIAELPKSEDFLQDFAAATAKGKEIAAKIEAHDREMFHRIVRCWRGVVGENKKTIEFSSEMLDMALGRDDIRAGFNEAYQEATSNDKARLGNSKA